MLPSVKSKVTQLQSEGRHTALSPLEEKALNHHLICVFGGGVVLRRWLPATDSHYPKDGEVRAVSAPQSMH